MRKLRLGEAHTHVKKLWRTTNLSEDLQWNLRLPTGEFDYSKVRSSPVYFNWSPLSHNHILFALNETCSRVFSAVMKSSTPKLNI